MLFDDLRVFNFTIPKLLLNKQFILKLKKHNNPSSNLNGQNSFFQDDKRILEENVNSNKLSIHELSKLSPSNEYAFEVKLSESEAKLSKLISEIDLLKKKVSLNLYY